MYEAWQAQQRAQKDEDRKAKSEAAAALQSYRRDGLTEEERKLAAIREQERLKKLEAERQLREYRGQMTEEEYKAALQRQEELRRRQQLDEQLRTNGVVTGNGVDIHSSLQALKDSGAVSAMATQYTSPQKPSQPQQQPRSSPPTSNGGAGREPADAVATPPPTFNAQSESTESVTIHGGHDITAALATSDAFSSNVDTTTTMLDPSLAPDLSTSPPTSIPSKVSFMFGILSSKDEIPAVDGYLALTDQIARTIIMDNPNTFQSVASSMSYPIAKSIEKDHCKYFYFDCIVVFFFTFSLWRSLQTIFLFASPFVTPLMPCYKSSDGCISIYGHCMCFIYCT
jgi:hypothetical protein